MNIQSVEAFNDGMAALRRGLGDLRESRDRKADLKQKMENEMFDREFKKKQLELAVNADRRAGMDRVDREMDRGSRDFNALLDNSRQNRETDARIEALKAQTAAAQNRGTAANSPIGRQLDGIEDFANTFAGALEENSAAMQQLQNPALQTDPMAFKAAQSRMLKAQIRLSALQQVSQGWAKDAGKEPTIDIEIPSEDGNGKMRMKVPQSQWGPSHPMYSRFASSGGGGSGPAPTATAPAPQPPRPMAPQDQQALAWAKANPNDPRAAAILQRLGK